VKIREKRREMVMTRCVKVWAVKLPEIQKRIVCKNDTNSKHVE